MLKLKFHLITFFIIELVLISKSIQAQNCDDSQIDIFSSCNGLNNGRVIITPQGVAPFTISFPNSPNNIFEVTNLFASNYTFNRLPPGNYPITITDAFNCVANFNAEIINSSGPTLNVSSLPNTNCLGERVPCDYSGPKILINEVCLSPTFWNGSIYTGFFYLTNYGEGEWIEIYNPYLVNLNLYYKFQINIQKHQ